jgi:four helix bundle protein
MKQFDHEKLKVYQEAIRFVSWLNIILVNIKKERSPVPLTEIVNQQDRASISIVLNIAEGNGRRQMKQRIKFFDDARGSATECAACPDILVAKGILPIDEIKDGKVLLLSVVSMLSRLIGYFENKFSLDEDSADYHPNSDEEVGEEVGDEAGDEVG